MVSEAMQADHMLREYEKEECILDELAERKILAWEDISKSTGISDFELTRLLYGLLEDKKIIKFYIYDTIHNPTKKIPLLAIHPNFDYSKNKP